MRLKGISALGSQDEGRDRLAVSKGLIDIHHSRPLKPPGMGGEIAVCHAGDTSKLHKLLPLGLGQGGQNPKPSGIGDKGIERHAHFIG